MDELLFALSDFGIIQVFKAETVFTLFMTGDNLASPTVVGAILDLVTTQFGAEYPTVEAMSNDEYFFLIILAPKK